MTAAGVASANAGAAGIDEANTPATKAVPPNNDDNVLDNFMTAYLVLSHLYLSSLTSRHI